MTRQLEQLAEQRQAKRADGIVRAVEYDLIGSVAHAGAELTGMSVKFGEFECLLTLRGVLAGRQQICFVGAEDLGSCLTKACALARADKLRWREDRFGS